LGKGAVCSTIFTLGEIDACSRVLFVHQAFVLLTYVMHDEQMQGQLGLLLNPHHLLQSYVVWVDCPAVYANKKFTSLSGKLDHNHMAPEM